MEKDPEVIAKEVVSNTNNEIDWEFDNSAEIDQTFEVKLTDDMSIPDME